MSRFLALCDILGLECHVGPPRIVRGVGLDVGRLALALEAVRAGFPDADARLTLHDWASCSLRSTPWSTSVMRLPVRPGYANSWPSPVARRLGVADAVPE